MKPILFFLLLIALLAFSTCKKDKSTIFSGQLLLTKKFPAFLSNRKIDIYQRGSPSTPINIGSSSSSATTVTDANGYFRLKFLPGEAHLIIFSGRNTSPLTLESSLGDTTFPKFLRQNFPDSGYDENKPTFIGKTIDTAIIKMSVLTDLAAADTIGLQAYTINGRLDKIYSGRTAPAGSVIALDTISNMLFTDFDCLQHTFTNNLYAGRKFTAFGYTTISAEGNASPYQLSETDETKQEIVFYFRK